jgi:hypothetical protein
MVYNYSNRVIPNLSGVSITYGAITFPPGISVQFAVRGVMDQAERNNKHQEVTVTVQGIWTNEDSSSDPNYFNTVRKVLLKSGQYFKIEGFPTGASEELNSDPSANAMLDAGPHPESLTYTTLGSQTVYFTWVCKYKRSNCSTTYGLGDFFWSTSFAIDENGMTTRTIRGAIEIRQQRTSAGSNTVIGAPDNWRDFLSFPRLPNFERTQNWTVTDDKRHLQFQITDTEIPSDNPYFPGMVKMKVNESLSSAMSEGGLTRWRVAFSGEITIAAGLPRALAWIAMLTVIQSRLEAMNAYGQTNIGGDFEDVTRINPHFRFMNEIYGRTLSFEVGYTLVCGLDIILKASGIWRPVPGTNWSAWATSMQSLHNNRGLAQLSTSVGDDVIVDYCTNTSSSGSAPPVNIPGLNYQAQNALDPGCPIVWYQFKNKLKFSRVTNSTELIPYEPGGGNDLTTIIDPSEVDGGKGGTPTQGGLTSKISYVQERSRSSTYLIMEGHGVRQSAKVPIPKVKTIGGQPAKLVEEEVTGSSLLGYTSNGCPIYIAKWRRVYYLPQGVDSKAIDLENVPPGFKPNVS